MRLDARHYFQRRSTETPAARARWSQGSYLLANIRSLSCRSHGSTRSISRGCSMVVLNLRARRAAGLALLSIPLAGFVAGCGESRSAGGPPGMGGPPPQVDVIVVQPQVLPVNFEYTGQTQGSREVEVRARVTGILLTRNYTEGSAVR